MIESPRTEDLKKLAGLLRSHANKIDETKSQKVANILVAATGLSVLEKKLRG